MVPDTSDILLMSISICKCSFFMSNIKNYLGSRCESLIFGIFFESDQYESFCSEISTLHKKCGKSTDFELITWCIIILPSNELNPVFFLLRDIHFGYWHLTCWNWQTYFLPVVGRDMSDKKKRLQNKHGICNFMTNLLTEMFNFRIALF